MKADPIVIREMERLFEQYHKEVYGADYMLNTQWTYTYYAEKMVKWAKGEVDLRGPKE